jgi:hypothetical protein
MDELSMEWVMAGENLTPEEIESMEASLDAEPDRLEVRCKLLGSYFLRQQDAAISGRRLSHIVWLVENHAEIELTGLPFCAVDPEDKEALSRVAAIWRRLLESDPEDMTILRRTAEYFRLADTVVSLELFEKRKSREPENYEWRNAIGAHYLTQARIVAFKGGADTKAAAASLAELLEAERLVEGEIFRFYLLSNIAEAAFLSGDLEITEKYASAMLQATEKFKTDWNYGNAIHKGHTFLGLVSISKDRLVEGRFHLKASNDHEGSPQLDSFGPSTDLGRRYSSARRSGSVVAFLRACGRYWEMGRDRIERWIWEIEQTGHTNFQRFYSYSEPTDKAN